MRNNLKHRSIKKALIFLSTVSLSAVLTVVILGKHRVTTVVKEVGTVLGVQTNREKQVKEIQRNKLVEADKILSSTPNPIPKISMEGKLANDPNRLETVKSLDDVWKIYKLSYAYKISENPKYLSKSIEYLLAWAKTYIASGNSIDEGHLQPLFEGYSWIRSYLNIEDRSILDNWLVTIADSEMKTILKDIRGTNNWNSHRINIIGQIGYLTGRDEYITYANTAYRQQVEDNLLPDGSSIDFVIRDALHYHSFNIFPLLNLAKTASIHGINLYDYVSPSGASLRKSVLFLFPYFSGEKTHKEFVNSTVAWDTKTGSKKINADDAKNWIPKNDLYILELAYYFEDSALPLIQKLRNTKAEVPSFETMFAYEQRNEITTISTPYPNIF